MIIVRITGGLGNQMFQYAVAKSMAKKNNDVFKLDTTFYPKQSLRKYELDLFNIKENIALNIDIDKLKGKEGLVYKIKNRLKIKNKKPNSYKSDSLLLNGAKNTIKIFEKQIFELKEDVYLDGYWQSEEYFKDIREEIIKDFTPKYDISEEAKKYIKEIENSNSISLHVRRGDYVDNAMFKGSGLSVTETSYYKDAIEFMNSKVENPKYFIFSDDISWCKENFDFLEDKVFVDDTKSAIDDMLLMSKCKSNIIANSTFSWWGAWLNQHKNKIVVVPKIWYRTNHKLHLAPKGWVKI